MVGQKVVCIDGSPPARPEYTPLRLVEGQIYTVRSTHTEPDIPGYGVRLVELVNPSIVWSDNTECEWAYQSERFRPVVNVDADLRESAEA